MKLTKGVLKLTKYDSLTGVYTREAFCLYAEELVRNNPDKSFDIVLSDFVNFKHFNERYGTKAGDYLLIKTGEMLLMAGKDVLCGRYGPDRFVSIMEHIEGMNFEFLEKFQLPESAKEELPTNSVIVKFGVCTDVNINSPISVFCDRAYVALESIKHQYGKNVAIYNEDLGKNIYQELVIEESMKDSLENKEFEIYYQPKMNISTGKICGAEALVRWNHPVLGYLRPNEFIPLFEKNGFITSMDMYVWKKVCEDLVYWKQNDLNVVPISVNISRKDFNKGNLSDMVKAVVDSYQLDHSLFHLEVTESSYVENPEQVVKQINQLHDNGFVIELDDFGNGYTSLSFLSDIKFDILKSDISIIQKDNLDSNCSALAFAMQLAKMMDLEMIQEGVETKEQLDRLTEMGCDYIQGYYYSKPLSKMDFEKIIS